MDWSVYDFYLTLNKIKLVDVIKVIVNSSLTLLKLSRTSSIQPNWLLKSKFISSTETSVSRNASAEKEVSKYAINSKSLRLSEYQLPRSYAKTSLTKSLAKLKLISDIKINRSLHHLYILNFENFWSFL
jgi:hypothetical protein